jgi:peptidoglycan hydrolase FlgJ
MISDFCRSEPNIPSIAYQLFTDALHIQENPRQQENAVQPSESIPAIGPTSGIDGDKHRTMLMEKAKSLEAAFLSEMLSHAGLGKSEGAFSGGIGEEQFASFLREAQAKSIVEHGGIGLAEHLFQSVVKYEQASE